MRLINNLVLYCDSQFSRNGRCTGCPNDDCQGGCEACLDAIHYRKRRNTYNCHNILHFYVCKYIYKYSSELDNLLSKLDSISSFDDLRIVSIGCGPCTDLAGILNYLARNGNNRRVTYCGFELNPGWYPVHEKIKEITTTYPFGITVHFEYGDALLTVPDNRSKFELFKPNILVFQYVISDLVKARVDIGLFANIIVNNIVPFMIPNSYIILNDINHNKQARDYFYYIKQAIEVNHAIKENRYYYHNKIRTYTFPYGSRHSTNALTSQVPHHIMSKYNPWQFCSSAQMAIKKVI